MAVQRVEIESTQDAGDPLASETVERLEQWLSLRPQACRTRRVYHFDLGLTDAEAERVATALTDPIAERSALGRLDDDASAALSVGLLPGVTDSVGTSVKRAAEDALGRPLQGRAYSSTLFLFWGLGTEDVERAAAGLLCNPLIQWKRIEQSPRAVSLDVPRAGVEAVPKTATVSLRTLDDAGLERLSADGMLALSLAEMKAIAAHFSERGRDPTDAELECLAQTWSEHCKHKTFASPIRYVKADGSVETIDDGLFARYIRGATKAVAAARLEQSVDPADAAFLVSVFHDNAGVVRFTDADHLAYKVETHNSPSALDPYGGAMTGIVGVNRDSFGTGLGADLLTNVWGYCFASSAYDGRVPTGLMHPRRLRDGVHHGVIDGGNQSGIPYSRGFELFDERYLGKPLVYCGTVSVMPAQTPVGPTHEKPVSVGDAIVMIGGRIGKDGIHGATFSSAELDESSPVQAVQIGDPITQKMMFDMLSIARDRGLFSGMTDNGAGGLSSSVGEMAEFTNGARIDLAKAPLKYPGLAPWEILISEAQERMTLAVRPEALAEFLALAESLEVEATVLGEFTDAGTFEVLYGDETIVDLPLTFLHDGWPKAVLEAELDPARAVDPADAAVGDALAGLDIDQAYAAVLGSENVAVDQDKCRGYDHEVKGLSVVKPLLGIDRNVPATATVMRARHGRPEGIVLAEGIHPFYSDLDARQMALACVDEAVRRVLCAGARWDRLAGLDNFCWPDPILSAKTPDGPHKLAQLVECCVGLREACEAYGVPLVSGKDSMKNDATLDGVKISIPPTLLVSVIGQMPNVGDALTLRPRTAGDQIWLLGDTRLELGGTELARHLGLEVGRVPTTEPEVHALRYRGFVALRDAGLISGAHVCGRGGLAVALGQMLVAGGVDLEVEFSDALALAGWLFSESTGRIVFTAPASAAAEIAAELGAGVTSIGRVAQAAAEPALTVRREGRVALSLGRKAAMSRLCR